MHDHRVLGCVPKDCDALLCLYVVNEQQWRNTSLGFTKTGPHRTRLLIDALADLNTALRAVGNRLVVLNGNPANVLAQAVAATGAAYVSTDAEVTSEECRTDDQVRASISVPLHRVWSRSLIHPSDAPLPPQSTPDTFTTWRKIVEQKLAIREEYSTPTELPPPPQTFVHAPFQIEELEKRCSRKFTPHSAFPFSGGEKGALERLAHYFFGSKAVSTYKETRNGLVGTEYSTKFSPWLANGSLSPRRIYYELQRFERTYGANHSTYWLLFELLWRDFFRFTAMKHGSALFRASGMMGLAVQWKKNMVEFNEWTRGETGEPFVDANMRELLHTGWMSNRGRQVVASWLTKTRHIDWRWGAMWFEHALLDYDVCSNWGNWAYVAGVGNDPREYRTFNPQKQAQTYDPDGVYRSMWLE